MATPIRVTRRRLDRSGYAFVFSVRRGREIVAEFRGDQLDRRGLSIGQAEREAFALRDRLRTEEAEATH